MEETEVRLTVVTVSTISSILLVRVTEGAYFQSFYDKFAYQALPQHHLGHAHAHTHAHQQQQSPDSASLGNLDEALSNILQVRDFFETIDPVLS